MSKYDKVGKIVISRTDKHFIIKVTRIRLVNENRQSIRLIHNKDYHQKMKNTIVLSIKQGAKLLNDCGNNYMNI